MCRPVRGTETGSKKSDPAALGTPATQWDYADKKVPFSFFHGLGAMPRGSTGKLEISRTEPDSRATPLAGMLEGLCLNLTFLKLTLPLWSEPSLALLPRPLLDWAEIHAFSPNSPGKATAARRIAVVKSEYCAHIYARPWSHGDLRSLALSTLKTFGPLSLFIRYQTDFLIVRLPADPECQVWREFYSGDPDPGINKAIHENFRNLGPGGDPSASPSQGDLAIDPETVDWSRYDAVIVQDLCIPERIVRKYPFVYWSYWIGETGGPSFKYSFKRPLAGYQIFLNGSSRRWRVRPGNRRHVLEFPYILQDSKAHARLGAKPWQERSGILLEVNTAQTISPLLRSQLEKIGPVLDNIGTPAERLQKLHHSRYFVQMISKPLWGNSLNEAVAAGCLALANPDSMPNNRSLLMPGLTPQDWESLLRILQKLEVNRERAEQQQRRQQAVADWILCHRPLSEWESRLEKFRKRGKP